MYMCMHVYPLAERQGTTIIVILTPSYKQLHVPMSLHLAQGIINTILKEFSLKSPY